MFKKTKLNRIAIAVAMSISLTGIAQAQSTSSDIRGMITTPTGSPAANTKIIIKHIPSGTVKEMETNAQGAFIAKGLRVGGPYEVVIDSDVHKDTTVTNVFLNLGETYRLVQRLESDNVERIQVTGTATVFDATGARSSYGQEEIARMPSFNRDLKDIVRNNPLAVVDASGDLSVGGQNSKFNSITVDGIGQNDDFGLNSGGYPAQRSPISLDAVEQISIDTTPFNTRQGGFSGGIINVVTKSGTNTFKGSTFYEFKNDNFSGDPENKRTDEDPQFNSDAPVENFATGKESTYGISYSGPILEDKLFFFVNYENFQKETPVLYGIGSGANQSQITQAEIDSFFQILGDVYGLTDQVSGDPEETDEKFLLKLDWNINDQHRADFTFQYQDNSEDRNNTDADDEIIMNSNVYELNTESTNFAARVFSDWNDGFSTEISMSYKNTEANSLTNSSLGEVNIASDNGDIVFGTDAFRHANRAETETLRLNFDANYLTGDHSINFGYHYENLNLFNLFAESSLGVWSFDDDRFDSTTGLEDFANRAPDDFRGQGFAYKNAFTNDANDTAYDATRETHVFYLEDNWVVSDELDVSFGVRYEYLASSDKPNLNPNFVDTYGFDNTENLDGLDIILPRASFKYYLNDDMTIRGGVGKYSGGKPNVWVVNSFTNDGITFVELPASVSTEIARDPANVDFTRIPQAALDALQSGTGSTNYVSKDYEMPSDWRYQLGFDWNFDLPYLGDGFDWSTEVNYVKQSDASFWIDSSRVDSGERTFDGKRIIYESRYEGDLADNFDIALTNADDNGRSIIWTTSLKKSWDNGVSMNMSYTNQDITNANPGSSSRSISNYQFNVNLNRNQPLIGTTDFETEHRFVLNLGYKTQFLDGYDTTFDLFFSRRSGRPLTYTLGLFRDDDFGDQPSLYSNSVYQVYLPSGPDDPNMDFDGGRLTYEEMKVIIDEAGLAAYQGGYAPKNATTQPWITTMDLNITQELPGFTDGHKSMVYLTVDNLANLLNDDWGQIYEMRFPQQSLFDLRGLSDDGRYQYEERFRGSDLRNWNEFRPEESTWRIKVGVRYTF
jgi:outer membrane receptor for ferrienterochelin and colicin